MKITIEVEDYLVEVAKYLWNNRQKIITDYTSFDFPDYGGLPKELSSKLSPDTVDAIQEEIFPAKCVFDDAPVGYIALSLGTYTFNETLFKLLKFDIMEAISNVGS